MDKDIVLSSDAPQIAVDLRSLPITAEETTAPSQQHGMYGTLAICYDISCNHIKINYNITNQPLQLVLMPVPMRNGSIRPGMSSFTSLCQHVCIKSINQLIVSSHLFRYLRYLPARNG